MWAVTGWAVATWLKITVFLALSVGAAWLWCSPGWFAVVVIVAVLVELNGVRAAAFTQTKTHRLECVHQDVPLRLVLRHLEAQTSCTRPQRRLLNCVQIGQELLEFNVGCRELPFARDRVQYADRAWRSQCAACIQTDVNLRQRGGRDWKVEPRRLR